MEQAGFELATPRSVLFRKLTATLAQDLVERKSALLERVSSPEFVSYFWTSLRVQLLFWECGRLATLGADF